MNGRVLLKIVNNAPPCATGFATVRHVGNMCQRCYGNLKLGVRFVQYKANQPQFVTPTQLNLSKYGIVVYQNQMLTEHNVPGVIRGFLIYMALSLPVICFVGYCDLVLRNESGYSMKDWKKGSGLLVLMLACGLLFAKEYSKRSIKRLYFNRKEKKIYIEALTGFCKPKMYGPYNPSIGSRKITTVKSKGSYITQELLVFEGKPMSARRLSREKITKLTEGMSASSSPFAILRSMEGHEMGNREFRIDVNGTEMKEKKLYKQLFRVLEEEEVEPRRGKEQFD